jgi:membrane protein required for beta-lactamase induction
MTLITVLIGLFIDRITEMHRESRVSRWFGPVAETIATRLPADQSGVLAALAVVVPPALLMFAVQWLVNGWLFGLVAIALGVVVLLLTLGPLDVSDVLEDYIEARRADDTERSNWFYVRFTGEQVPDTIQEEGRCMVEAVLVRAHDHVFATVFWFCLLGPAGAVLYRMAAEAALQPAPGIVARPALHRALRHVLGALGWLPARLMAFGYAMTGSFEHALSRMRATTAAANDLLTANQWLLINTGTGALRGDDELERDTPGSDGDRRSHHPAAAADGARRLTLRTGVLWLAALALLTLAGWIS